jgi:hypothetical protein
VNVSDTLGYRASRAMISGARCFVLSDMSTQISVQELVGHRCMTVEQGTPVYVALSHLLRSGEQAVLDFSGVIVCTSPFLNASIGRLLRDFSPQELDGLFRIENLTPVGVSLVRPFIEDSTDYSRDPAARKAIDRILHEQHD